MADKTLRGRATPDGRTPPTSDGQPIENEILLGLPAKERESIFPQLTFMELKTHLVLHEPGEPIKFGYFLNSGLASVLTVLTEGKSVEVGIIDQLLSRENRTQVAAAEYPGRVSEGPIYGRVSESIVQIGGHQQHDAEAEINGGDADEPGAFAAVHFEEEKERHQGQEHIDPIEFLDDASDHHS